MKISNELLRAVYGYECEFIQINDDNEIEFKDLSVAPHMGQGLSENLDTFIRIAKNGFETYSQERDLLILEDALNNKTLGVSK